MHHDARDLHKDDRQTEEGVSGEKRGTRTRLVNVPRSGLHFRDDVGHHQISIVRDAQVQSKLAQVAKSGGARLEVVGEAGEWFGAVFLDPQVAPARFDVRV